jgi:hypothetical protein
LKIRKILVEQQDKIESRLDEEIVVLSYEMDDLERAYDAGGLPRYMTLRDKLRAAKAYRLFHTFQYEVLKVLPVLLGIWIVYKAWQFISVL